MIEVTPVPNASLAEDGLRFIAEASELLSSSLDYEMTLARVARLSVPRLADWCAVDIMNVGGHIQRLAVEHIDPKKIQFVHEIEAKYPPDPNATTGLPQVLRTGRSEFYPEIPQEMLDAGAIDEEHLRLIQELGLVSAMVVPLIARNIVFGAITLVSAESKRHFTEADFRLAEDLGRRAAMAVDNAWLYHKAQAEIEDRKEAEEELRKAKDQAEANGHELEAANQAKDRFLAMLSHELRSPLTPILAMAEALQAEAIPNELRPWLEIIQRNVEIEAHLIDDLLDLTRISKGKLQLSHENVDIHGLLLGVIEMYRSDISAKSIQIEIALHAREHYVDGDSGRLRQIFWNIIKNAQKFTPRGGQISIRTSNKNEGADSGEIRDKILIEIADTGIGIERNLLTRIFDAFEQGERASPAAGGLGLGLAISKSLVEAHGGVISAESPGNDKGSTFIVELITVPPPTVTSVAVEIRTARVDGRKRTILLVDDHADTSAAVKMLLERRGYTVRVAGSSAEAIRAVKEAPVDLIISDIGLPDESGHAMLPKLREICNAPAIALSGFGSDEDMQRSRDAGFQEHVTKPFNLQKLRDTITRLLESK